MRRALLLVGSIALVVAAARAALRRRTPKAQLEPAVDPADELRRTLRTSREPEDVESESARPSLEDRRARVHEKAQEAIDLMQEQGGE